MSNPEIRGDQSTGKWPVVLGNDSDRFQLERAEARPPRVHAPAGQLQKAESHVPDGHSAIVYEAPLLPWVVGTLAVVGIGVVALLMSPGGWRAVLIGEAWLLTGYAVSWIVVWGAGLLRARDEHEIEEHIIQDGFFDDRHDARAGQ